MRTGERNNNIVEQRVRIHHQVSLGIPIPYRSSQLSQGINSPRGTHAIRLVFPLQCLKKSTSKGSAQIASRSCSIFQCMCVCARNSCARMCQHVLYLVMGSSTICIYIIQVKSKHSFFLRIEYYLQIEKMFICEIFVDYNEYYTILISFFHLFLFI